MAFSVEHPVFEEQYSSAYWTYLYVFNKIDIKPAVLHYRITIGPLFINWMLPAVVNLFFFFTKSLNIPFTNYIHCSGQKASFNLQIVKVFIHNLEIYIFQTLRQKSRIILVIKRKLDKNFANMFDEFLTSFLRISFKENFVWNSRRLFCIFIIF